ncbi:trimeric intracellular cation channel family protein [Nocardia amikacinitolerans]|uniref:trimeric intracellular cation channel family protein n=1 Tax=Nocardia amikacinitolerans TaxID=756689 RepID=UPI0020A59292|nr:trimeric intracellular cation channel family protein [Nocardia amikacinitolerans]MCP2291788.1 putative membrane protein YeiH [Nocardia amikacinitolerans]
MVAGLDVMATQLDSAVNAAQRIGELLGVVSFAASGALLAVRKNMDVFGMAVLACSTALGGGVIRDLLIGRTPPAAFTDLTYLCASLLTALVIIFKHPSHRLTGPLEIFDAIGLGLFCVTGTAVAYAQGVGAPTAALLGMVTAIGGGVIRDVLGGEVPRVLRPDQELYAVPALLGAAATATLLHFDAYWAWTGLLAAFLAIAFRLLARRYGWHAPQALRNTGRLDPSPE